MNAKAFTPFFNTPLIRLFAAAAIALGVISADARAQEATWQWAKSAGSAGNDAFTGVARNADGSNIFAVGRFSNSMILGPGVLNSAGGSDAVLARYHPTGATIWAVRMGGSGNDAATAAAVDILDNVYVVGAFENRMAFGGDTLISAGGTDIFIAKYTAGGNYLWARRAGGAGNDVANAVALDAAGNVYVGGVFRDSARFGSQPWLVSAGGADMCLAQYAPDGAVLWSVRAGGVGTDVLTALAINAGGVYAAGSFTDSLTIGADFLKSAGESDIALVKYNTSGAAQWARRAGGIGTDAGYALALDLAGNILVGGTTGDSAAFGAILTGRFGAQDGFAAQYNSSGTAQWARTFGGAGDDVVMGIGTDSTGAAYCGGFFSQTAAIGGRTLTSAGLTDVFGAKYSPTGAPLWSKRGGGEDADYCYDLLTDLSRSSYLCGSFYYQATYNNTILGGQGGDDLFITRLLNVVANDVGVVDILFPQAPFAPGAAQVAAVIQNFGTGVMDTVRIEWDFNGVPQTTRFSGKDIAPGGRDTVQLGLPTFPEKIFSLVYARTVTPNNSVDPNAANDEYGEAMGPGLLKGAYSLGGTQPDFATFSEAARYLNTCGVLDTVFVDVRQGLYREQFILQQIPGVSASKRLTIRKQQGQASRPQLNFTTLYPNNNYALLLDGTDYVTLHGLSVAASGSDYNRAVLLRNGTTGIVFDSNAVSAPATAVDGCMMSDPANDCAGLTVANNTFTGGRYGLWMRPTTAVAGVDIKGNRFENYLYWGIVAENLTGAYIRNNALRTSVNDENMTGLWLSNLSGGSEITGNALREIPSGTGIHLRESAGTSMLPLLVANNMVQIGAGNVRAQGMGLLRCGFVNVYHNTINLTTTHANERCFTVNTSDSVTVMNNLFYNSGGGYAYSVVYPDLQAAQTVRSDYNALYSTGPILGTYQFDTTVYVANLAAWRAALTGFDANSVSKVVTFQNDLTHLTVVDSLLFGDAALRSAVTTDIDGQPRRSPYMGADEVIPLITITDQTEYRQIFCLGSTAVFHVNATISHAGKLRYQWQINGQDIPDSTKPTLTLVNVTRNSEAFFRCIVTGNSGADTVYSDRIQLLVINATEILRDPRTRYVLEGQTAEFEVLAEAAPPNGANQVIYRWYRNGTLLTNSQRIAGATTSMLRIFNAQLSDVDTNYYATVDGACGSDTSARFALLMPGAAFDRQPQDTSICGGDTVQISASVRTGIPGLELQYLWMRGTTPLANGVKYDGIATPVLTVKGLTPADTGSDYRLRATVVSTGAILFSDEAAVRMNAATAIVQPPVAAQACETKPHTFTVSATGVGLLYQWQRNDTNIAGANTTTYTIPVLTKSSPGRYRVVVTGKCGTVTSQEAVLTLKAVPFVLVNPPKTHTANIGRMLSLTVNIGGPTPIRYTWYRNGVVIPNQVSNILIIDSAKKSDTGRYWCVAENDCGSVRTDTCLVRVEPLAVAEGAPAPMFAITSVQPNPVSGEAAVEFTVAVPCFVRLTLTDAYGREVRAIAAGIRDEGSHTAVFDATGLASGRYFCTLTTPTGAVTVPLTVLR